jgi:hypothetical protein
MPMPRCHMQLLLQAKPEVSRAAGHGLPWPALPAGQARSKAVASVPLPLQAEPGGKLLSQSRCHLPRHAKPDAKLLPCCPVLPPAAGRACGGPGGHACHLPLQYEAAVLPLRSVQCHFPAAPCCRPSLRWTWRARLGLCWRSSGRARPWVSHAVLQTNKTPRCCAPGCCCLGPCSWSRASVPCCAPGCCFPGPLQQRGSTGAR